VRVQWTSAAVDDLVAARIRIAQSNPDAAGEIAQRVLSAVEVLTDYPAIGRAGRAKGTQELVIAGTSYILVYRTFKARIQVLRVLHGRRRWPARSRKRS
jgi:addiction module RelE/StbE family toxin